MQYKTGPVCEASPCCEAGMGKVGLMWPGSPGSCSSMRLVHATLSLVSVRLWHVTKYTSTPKMQSKRYLTDCSLATPLVWGTKHKEATAEEMTGQPPRAGNRTKLPLKQSEQTLFFNRTPCFDVRGRGLREHVSLTAHLVPKGVYGGDETGGCF